MWQVFHASKQSKKLAYLKQAVKKREAVKKKLTVVNQLTELSRAPWVRNTSVGDEQTMMTKFKKLGWQGALVALALSTVVLPIRATAQDDPGDDPPTRVARLGYIEGSVSMQPA